VEPMPSAPITRSARSSRSCPAATTRTPATRPRPSSTSPTTRVEARTSAPAARAASTSTASRAKRRTRSQGPASAARTGTPTVARSASMRTSTCSSQGAQRTARPPAPQACQGVHGVLLEDVGRHGAWGTRPGRPRPPTAPTARRAPPAASPRTWRHHDHVEPFGHGDEDDGRVGLATAPRPPPGGYRPSNRLDSQVPGGAPRRMKHSWPQRSAKARGGRARNIDVSATWLAWAAMARRLWSR